MNRRTLAAALATLFALGLLGFSHLRLVRASRPMPALLELDEELSRRGEAIRAGLQLAQASPDQPAPTPSPDALPAPTPPPDAPPTSPPSAAAPQPVSLPESSDGPSPPVPVGDALPAPGLPPADPTPPAEDLVPDPTAVLPPPDAPPVAPLPATRPAGDFSWSRASNGRDMRRIQPVPAAEPLRSSSPARPPEAVPSAPEPSPSFDPLAGDPPVEIRPSPEDPNSEAKVRYYVRQLIAAREASDSPDYDPTIEKRRAIVNYYLREQFDARQRRHEEEIAALEARVAKLKELARKRGDNRDAIIRKRLDQLLSEAEGLGW